VRAVVLDPAHEGMSDRAEALLFAAARGEHVHRVVRPALERGAVVVCDRARLGGLSGRGRSLAEAVAGLSLWATLGLLPDLTVLLDVDPALGWLRYYPNRLGRGAAGVPPRGACGLLLAAADPLRCSSSTPPRAGGDRAEVAARVEALLARGPAPGDAVTLWTAPSVE
jgi:dTMP kinase